MNSMAMARVESDWYPWCLNIEGKDVRPKSFARAVQLAEQALRAGKSVDVGLMQINSYWLKKLHIAPEVALQPRNNVILGLYVLTQEVRRHGATWKAVGAYHSPTVWRQQRYARKVHTCLAALQRALQTAQAGQAQAQVQGKDKRTARDRLKDAPVSLSRPLPELSESSTGDRPEHKAEGRADSRPQRSQGSQGSFR